MITVRGIPFQENLNNDMGLEFYDLSHPWGLGQPCWPYFEDVKIERLHTMAKSGVLTQRITTVMHSGTHIDAPRHFLRAGAGMETMPLDVMMGPARVVDVDDPEAGQWRARLEAEQRVDGAVRVLQVVIGVDQHDAIDHVVEHVGHEPLRARRLGVRLLQLALPQT